MQTQNSEHIDQRVNDLIALYSGPSRATAALLCDGHPENSLAFRIVREDFSTTEITFCELRTRSEKLAHALYSEGFRAGDRIATLMGKSQEYLETILAIWRLGAVHVPLFTAFAGPAIEMRLTSSGTKAVFSDAVHLDKLKEIRGAGQGDNWVIVSGDKVDDGDFRFEDLMSAGQPDYAPFVGNGDTTFIEIYTSGTTGTPKGVPVPVKALASFRAYAEFGLNLRADDVFWNAADPGWGYGLYFGILAVLTTGVAGLLYTGKFSAEATFRILEQEKVTNFTAAPTVYRSLRTYEGKTPSLRLRCASAAGEPLTPDVNRWAPEALGVEVHDHFGQTEAGMVVNNHHHPELHQPIRPGSMGRPMPGWSATILDEKTLKPLGPGRPGLLAFELSKSPMAWFEGYIGAPKKTAERLTPDGKWYVTGDIAKFDEDGMYYFSSRDDDVIIMAGYRIGPFEVESVLVTHPAVVECAVIALPDELRGQVLEAVVALADGVSPSEELTQELQAKVKKEYAAHAYPRRIHYKSALPKTPSGKVQRFRLRQELTEDEKGAQA
ncbi:AMP-binding protein [Marinobacter salarius]|uniref:AMP-binding protein n=1 Tax=Marinobacter salarius TaxID=1420917 RepID=UPI00273A90C6|nr:AMP-binding protein [Marinobacter salarius]MDP4532882.1 AMP-binding protein [Marinobacter salarius]